MQRLPVRNMSHGAPQAGRQLLRVPLWAPLTWQACGQHADVLGDAVAARHAAGVYQLVLHLVAAAEAHV